jgi:hypothetical protein
VRRPFSSSATKYPRLYMNIKEEVREDGYMYVRWRLLAELLLLQLPLPCCVLPMHAWQHCCCVLRSARLMLLLSSIVQVHAQLQDALACSHAITSAEQALGCAARNNVPRQTQTVVRSHATGTKLCS